MARQTVTLPDGRAMEVRLFGAEDGPAVVAHHGTPMSGMDPDALDGCARARGIRMVAPTRAGYGASTRDPGRDVAAAARDTAALCDALGIGRFAAIGWSGGGPHALACAALLPERCAAAISLAGVAPYLPGEFEWTDGMDEENVKEFALALEGGPAYEAMLAEVREVILAFEPTAESTARDVFGGLVSERDVEGTTPGDVAWLVRSAARGLERSTDGWHDDDQAFLHEWGFDPASITVPVGVWYGDLDRMVPARHGEWLAANVSGAVARRFDNDGHLTLVLCRAGEILDTLTELAGGPW